MDAIKFLVEKTRLTKDCGIPCKECRLSQYNNGLNMDCIDLRNNKPDEYVDIISKWSEEQPFITNIDKFKEIEKDISKIISNTFKIDKFKNSESFLYCRNKRPMLFCHDCAECQEFWNSEYKEEK